MRSDFTGQSDKTSEGAHDGKQPGRKLYLIHIPADLSARPGLDALLSRTKKDHSSCLEPDNLSGQALLLHSQ